VTNEVRVLLTEHALNGESPIWCERRRRLFWVDLRKPSLHAFDPATGEDMAWEMPAWIGCYGLTNAGALVALRTGLFRFDFASGALDAVAPCPFDPRRFLFNDGRCDPRGRFLAGTMYLALQPGDQQPDAPKGTPLWRHRSDGAWEPITPDVQTSNGLAFSPDGRRMYHSDTAQKTVWVWDYDPDSGALDNRRVFVRVEDAPEQGGPDGANVDRDGFYWCAIFGAGALHRYDPDGRLERKVPLPVRYPTMPAFGGEDRATIFVTSAAWPIPPAERGRHPNEGGLLGLPAPVPGLAEPYVAAQQTQGEG